MISYSALCRLLLAVVLFIRPIEAFNRSLFFRSSSFWDEPRFDAHGSLLLIYKFLEAAIIWVKQAAANECLSLASMVQKTLQLFLGLLPGTPSSFREDPHTIRFQSVADVFEADFNLYQNFCNGFFTQFHFPVILLQIYPSGFCEGSDTSKKYHPAWQATLQTLANFLKPYDLNICPHRNAAPFRLTLFVGWTHSFENTSYLDFIDVTAKTGVLFPTGKKKSLTNVFDIPYGYNGHWAIPFSGDISIGAFDWLTLRNFTANNLLFFQ